MAKLIIEQTIIKDLLPLENSDNLQIAKVFDWDVVVRRSHYNIGDEVIYLPPDTVISEEFEKTLFPEGSKIKLHNRRIRAVRIRGKVSQGMLIDPDEYTLDYVLANTSKYEPPVSEMPSHMGVKTSKKPDLKAFHKYTDIENFKYYDRIFQDGEQVYISLKAHGTSSRFMWTKSETNTPWQKFLKFLGLLPEWTFAWGTRNVQIQTKLLKRHKGVKIESQGVDFGDVYTKMVHQYNLKEKIPKGYGIYGEIIGSGVQSNYMYDCATGEHKLKVYDVYNVEEKRWLNHAEFVSFVDSLGLERVPEMYVGPYSKQILESFLTVNPLGKEVNEGVVIKPVVERISPTIGRVVLKVINPEYYLIKTTDFH